MLRDEILDCLSRIENKIDHLNKERESSKSPYWDIIDVARFFKIEQRTVYNWLYRGKIKGFKVNGRLLFRKEDIEKMNRMYMKK